MHTTGGVARAIVALNLGEFRAAVEVPHDNDLTWNQLCDTVTEHFRVPRESLSPDTRFVEDLGC